MIFPLFNYCLLKITISIVFYFWNPWCSIVYFFMKFPVFHCFFNQNSRFSIAILLKFPMFTCFSHISIVFFFLKPLIFNCLFYWNSKFSIVFLTKFPIFDCFSNAISDFHFFFRNFQFSISLLFPIAFSMKLPITNGLFFNETPALQLLYIENLDFDCFMFFFKFLVFNSLC